VDIFRTGSSSDADVLQVLFGAKNSDFSKFMVCPHGKGGERNEV